MRNQRFATDPKLHPLHQAEPGFESYVPAGTGALDQFLLPGSLNCRPPLALLPMPGTESDDMEEAVDKA